jgi:hypothetical protein
MPNENSLLFAFLTSGTLYFFKSTDIEDSKPLYAVDVNFSFLNPLMDVKSN